jgi:hypothetical protein
VITPALRGLSLRVLYRVPHCFFDEDEHHAAAFALTEAGRNRKA